MRAHGMVQDGQTSDTLKSLSFEASGLNYPFGQSFRPGGPLPEFTHPKYNVEIDYTIPSMRIDSERMNSPRPQQGGVGALQAAPIRSIQNVSGTIAWNVNAAGASARAPRAAVEDRLLQLWVTPPGIVKAARQAGSAAVLSRSKGRRIVIFPLRGRMIKATLNADTLVERVEYMIDNPVTGDTPVEIAYTGYTKFDGVPFPTRIVQKVGGQAVLDLNVSRCDCKSPAVDIAVPENVKAAAETAPVAAIVPQKLADGVYLLPGGANSVAVEFKDFIALVDGPANDDRTQALLDVLKKTFPGKPLRYVINTHHHYDHSGGLRGFVAEGVTILAQSESKPHFQKVWKYPHTLAPDRLANAPKAPVIEAVKDMRILTDGTQKLELHRLAGNNHAATMLIPYLPAQKILMEPDLYQAAQTAPGPNEKAAPFYQESGNLYDQISACTSKWNGLSLCTVPPRHSKPCAAT
ncbi:MAG: MBL fold metallo-hydrolase [Bryobacteraceae bacterium]